MIIKHTMHRIPILFDVLLFFSFVFIVLLILPNIHLPFTDNYSIAQIRSHHYDLSLNLYFCTKKEMSIQTSLIITLSEKP